MPVKVMISYSWSDDAVRIAVADKLSVIEGVEVLYDKKDIRPGGLIHDKISSLLSETDFVVAILTSKALKSHEVLDELSRAHERGKVIVPLVPEGLAQKSLPSFLGDTSRIAYRPRNVDPALQELARYFEAAVFASHSEEIELKFESTTSLQFKFSAIESSGTVLRKVRALCEILDVEIGRQIDTEIVDEYFDDEFASLVLSACSFRRRDEGGKHLVTMKSYRGLSSLSALRRGEYEFQCDDEEFRDFLKSPRRLSKEFKDHLGIDILCDRLVKVVTLKTKRTSLELRTRVNTYKFSHDLFYYILHDQGTEPEFSEYNAEIEIELKGRPEQKDPQLEKLRNGISSLLFYAPNQKSKFQRGIEWVRRRTERSRYVFVVSFGLLDFSRLPDRVQKQQIQILNHHVKEVLREMWGKKSMDELSLISLATGDGMILVLEEPPEDVIRLVSGVQKRIRPTGDPVFRVGIHAGPVFRYSDVNESLSYAGNGISVAHCLMESGDAWHVLASDSMRLALQASDYKADFHEIPSARSADAIFNVFDDCFGNRTVPSALAEDPDMMGASPTR